MSAALRRIGQALGPRFAPLARFLTQSLAGRALVFLSLPLVLLAVAFWEPDHSPPIFDVQMHYNDDVWRGYPARGILRGVQKLNVPWVALSSVPNEGTWKLYDLDRARFLPFFVPYRTRDDRDDWFEDPRTLDWLERELDAGVYRGIGEIHLYAGGVDRPVVRRLLALAVERRLVLNVHGEAEVIRALFAIEPRSRVIWAHAGATARPAQIGALLERYPTLWAELSHRPDVAPDGVLAPEWRALFLDWPERFLLGSGTYSSEYWYQFRYILGRYRDWLRELPPPVAERIAHRNALELFAWP
jgi:hypothetical protein